MRRWREPVDLPLLRSQTKYKWSVAPGGADVDSATHDMETERGDGGEPTVHSGPPQDTYKVVVFLLRETMA